jgi:hypothetical protein
VGARMLPHTGVVVFVSRNAEDIEQGSKHSDCCDGRKNDGVIFDIPARSSQWLEFAILGISYKSDRHPVSYSSSNNTVA